MQIQKKILLVGSAKPETIQDWRDSGYTVELANSLEEAMLAAAACGCGQVVIDVEHCTNIAHRHAEEELHRSRQLLHQIIDNTPAAIYVKDRNGRLLIVNKALADVIHTPEEQILGKTAYDFYPKEMADAHTANDELVLRTGMPMQIEEVAPGENGVRTFITIKFPVREEGGSIYGVAGISTEITERKRAEEEIIKARSEAEQWVARLESFLRSMADGMALFDSDGNILYMNDAGKRILGSEDIDTFHKWDRMLPRWTLDGNPLPTEQTATYRALRGETVKGLRYWTVTPEGKKIVLSVSAAPVHDSHGNVIGATNTFRDATERVEFEQKQDRLLKREQNIADMLQQTLIPAKASYEVPCCSVAVKYQPAWNEAEVGGDFYDVFEISEDKVAVLIGDVAGKGLDAAIRVAAARHTIRSYAYLDPDPATVMTLANDALSRDLGDGSGMLTAFLAIVDTREKSVAYANGGHEPALIMDINGNIEELAASGRALGVLSGYDYPLATRELKDGDRIVMFTDGITEARRNGSSLFGVEGIVQYLQTCKKAPADDIASGLLKTAKKYAGGSLQDDAAIIIFEITE
jgi:PAS domain S-box-containing protein